MSKHKKGDVVVATKDIGGYVRENVSKGSTGVVTESPWFGDATVLFTVTSLFGDKKVAVTVTDDEVR